MSNEEEVPPIKVPSKDEEKSEENVEPSDDGSKIKVDKDNVKILKEGELSPEDQVLKLLLESSVSKVVSLNDVGMLKNTINVIDDALEVLKREIQSATSSLTSVPKPLKFLKPHFDKLKDCYSKFYLTQQNGVNEKEEKVKRLFADILSVLSMTVSPVPIISEPNKDNKDLATPATSSSSEQNSTEKMDIVESTLAAENEQVLQRRDILRYKLQGNRLELGEWGHEYVRTITSEIASEYNERILAASESSDPVKDDDLIELVRVIVPFQIKHNSETEAIDILIEMDRLEWLLSTSETDLKLVDEHNYSRVALYLIRYADYVTDAEELKNALHVAYDVYSSQKQYTDSLRIAMRLNDLSLVRKAMRSSKKLDKLQWKQMAMMLGEHRMFSFLHDSEDDEVEDNEEEIEEDDEDELMVKQLVRNTKIWERFQTLARELNVEEAKTPEDVYKSHLGETSSLRSEIATQQIESATTNLASTYVNAFVNCGFQKDRLITTEDSGWLAKNKEHGVTSVVASLGMILQWNVDEGMTQIDKYLYSENDFIKAGALLAFGINNSGVSDESDPVYAVLQPFLKESDNKNSDWVKICASLGLGAAYSGNPNPDVLSTLLPLVQDSSSNANMEVVSMAGLALGLAFVGTANEDVTMAILQRLMESSKAELDQAIARHLILGLGLCFLGKQEGADAMIEALQVVEHDIAQFATVLVEACAYAGSGNVLKIQKMLHLCAEHPAVAKSEESDTSAANTETSTSATGAPGNNPSLGGLLNGAGATPSASAANDEESTKKEAPKLMHAQSAAVIAISLITMAESVGKLMAERTYHHLLSFGDLSVRRAVPLAIGISHISEPLYETIDVLSKLTHDADIDTAMSAIFALGLIGAGTNNSRIAGLLRQLSSFYSKEPHPLFVVRLAQAVLHLGKGLLTLSPIHSDRTLVINSSVAGILATVLCGIDFTSTLLSKFHILMFTLVCAARPRMIMTVDENLEPLQVNVRVGTAVETVGLAGQPKTITGFQTHTTPALLSTGERCELGDNEKWKSMTNVVEGIVIIRPNQTIS